MDIQRRHPCFDEEAHAEVGRVHLPVAPRCNIQCAFCERRVCANLTMQHPGWALKVITPAEALAQVRALVEKMGDAAFVVGVAGPGEPLANEETLVALGLVHRAFPHLVKCISSNGLLLEERLGALCEVGVSALTVTVNAPDAAVGAQIYTWVRYHGRIYRGADGAALLLERQWAGLKVALAAGLTVKVNTVLVPGVNDAHVQRLAQMLKQLGVPLMNIMPLIPGGAMRARRAPTREELDEARLAGAGAVRQFKLCQQCRADVVCFPGKEVAGDGGAPN